MTANLALKYAEERNKRLRPDTVHQYSSVRSAEIADLGHDPWIDYQALANEKPFINDGDRIKFLIIGGGHSGLLYAHRLIEAGFQSSDICIVDTAGGYGGTWYWNRYPGLMCDVESYCYLPLLEETGHIPSYKYSPGFEIRQHSERIAKKNDLHALFGTKVDSQKWDEEKGEWTVKMTRNFEPVREAFSITVQAQFVLGAGGIFPSPKIPNLPGFDELRSHKHVFHTSRWDYEYTGGSQEDPALVNLKDKVVGIIGTGATAVQVVPAVAKWAKHLYVFQRTPSYCGARMQRKTDPETWKKVAYKEGWQLERRQNFNSFVSNDPAPVDLVNDGWTEQRALAGAIGNPKLITPDKVEEHLSDLFKLDVPRAEKVRARVDEVVKDVATAEKLKPWYHGWCKRPTFHDDYLEAFNLPNVTLVDTDGKGIDRYTKHGIVANGVEYVLDTLILGTGYTSNLATTSPTERMDTKTVGRDERELQAKWINSDDFGTLLGVATNQFPNLFFNAFSGAATSLNLTSVLDINAKLVANIISEASRKAQNPEKLIIEVSKDAEDKYTAEVKRRSLWFSVMAACTPGYFSEEGAAATKTPEELERIAKYSTWGGGPLDYETMVDAYKAAEDLKGFEIRT
ncbi:putative monooxygenase [Whalleya microplaca]|nr:putative monooxygenase [Whalleya microplaca]